jgi:hypothetical protein
LLPFFPRGFIGVDRLSGRYCVPQTVDQSERRTNELRQTVGKSAVKVTGERSRFFTNLQPCFGLRAIDIAGAI